jgi:hypothetical protein
MKQPFLHQNQTSYTTHPYLHHIPISAQKNIFPRFVRTTPMQIQYGRAKASKIIQFIRPNLISRNPSNESRPSIRIFSRIWELGYFRADGHACACACFFLLVFRSVSFGLRFGAWWLCRGAGRVGQKRIGRRPRKVNGNCLRFVYSVYRTM